MPEYTIPKTYKVGGKHTNTPFVTSAQLKGHLALLRAFAQLRTKIDGLKVEAWKSDRYIPDKPNKRWVWFVGFAVESNRFAAFVNVQGDGYLQEKIRIHCCRKDRFNDHYINTGVLVLRKFAEDAVREDGTPQSYFAYVCIHPPSVPALIHIAAAPCVLRKPPPTSNVQDTLKNKFYPMSRSFVLWGMR
ncbi:hypothetical protein H0H87_008167 [Tephrocybe sp. NHM501043]|nr:hypothetical protein H0H87_008167 [Tephrocybe sp. NHM501043]